jgi:hypothetical protein
MYNEETYWIPGDIENATEAMGWGQSSQGGTDYTEGAITNVGQWAVGFAIETNYGITGAPGLAYNYWDGTNDPMAPVDYDPSWAAGYYYDGQSVLHTAEASQPEMATGNNMYMVMQSFNGAYSNISFKATVTDLNPASPTFLFTSGGGPSGMDKYADIEVWPIKQFYVAVDATDPDVGAKGDIVAVVYAQDGAVKCSVSEDAGLNWTVNTVAAAGGYPAVYVAEGKIYCAYVNGGNLYFTFSTDNGATWGTPVQLNDQTGSVAAIPGTVDIGAAGFVWTDTRNAENDIYYEYMLMEPPAEVPELTIVAVTGGIGAKATIGNVGNAAATNVAWTIEVTGGILGKINVQGEGTIASLAADAEDSSAKTKMILGLGAISVKVTATCDEGSTASVTKAGKQLLIFTSIPAA